MIRKEGKARWVYECQPCNHKATAVDQLRVLEAQNHHLRGNFVHFNNVMVEAFKPLVDFVKTFVDITEQTQKDYALIPPPPNIPHDPSLLKDRRKWGGR